MLWDLAGSCFLIVLFRRNNFAVCWKNKTKQNICFSLHTKNYNPVKATEAGDRQNKRTAIMSKGKSQLCCTWEEHDSRCAWKAQRRWGIGLARGSKVMSKGADGLHCTWQTERRSVVSWTGAVALKQQNCALPAHILLMWWSLCTGSILIPCSTSSQSLSILTVPSLVWVRTNNDKVKAFDNLWAQVQKR